MGFFNRLTKKEKGFSSGKATTQVPISKSEETINMELPEAKLVSFSEEVLDTTSRASVEKLKHNLSILIEQAKQKGKVDKFVLIREDDIFPDNWEWTVLSKNTNLQKTNTGISYELRKALAMEKSGVSPYLERGKVKVPNPALGEKTRQVLSQLDKTIGTVLLPPRFRSTKHFTMNTPLAVTGDYNFVETNRDFIVIDDINAFLESGYGYSVSYHDAYLDISHESLPISENAVVLINDNNYERIISDEKVACQLRQRRVVRYKGDEVTATNMILTEMGVLPSRVDYRYAEYNQEIFSILDNSMKALAEENSLFFDKSHAGQEGHFSDYYDNKNHDHEIAVNEFVAFINQQISELSPKRLTHTQGNAKQIIEEVGTTKLLEIINEYNELVSHRLAITSAAYQQDRQNITPEVHQKFVKTISLINQFYQTNPEYKSEEERLQTEETIQKFMQADTVSDQLKAGQSVIKLISKKELDLQDLYPLIKKVTSSQINHVTQETKEAQKITLEKEHKGNERN